MKTLFHFIVLVSLSGCSFLKPSVQHEDPEETAYSEEQSEETGDEAEDSQEFFEGSEEDDEDDFQEDEETVEDETEPEGEKKGFFARIFGWGDDETEDSDEENYQDDEENGDTDFEGDDSFDEESDTGDSEGDGFIEESTDDTLAPIDESSAEGETVSPEETSAEKGTEQPAQPSTESQSDLPPAPPAATTPSSTEAEEPAPKQFIPLKKIKAQTYTKGNYLVNSVYIARDKDTIESVSQKIYNEDHQEALYTINPHFRNRTLKVGDKVYYSSPRRPQDSSGILTYYEDMGISSQIHMIAAGQNIRAVSQSLLGHKDSWKEIWATNPGILSKGTVTESMELKYWSADAAAAHQEEVPAPEEAEMQEESPATDEEAMKPAEEPPSPDTNIPDPVKITENRKKGFNMGQLFLMGALAIAIIFSFMIIIKKRRKKREFDYTATNI